MTPTNWKPPRTGDALLKVKFRDGTTSKTAHPAAKWTWANRNYAFDIIAWSIEP